MGDVEKSKLAQSVISLPAWLQVERKVVVKVERSPLDVWLDRVDGLLKAA